MNYETLGNNVTDSYVFKGSKHKPLLAPRGVFVFNNMLFVSDTGQNRVFIWNSLPTSEYEEPDIILGQIDVENSGRNSGGNVSASSLHYPSGIWSNGSILIVADAWNHRVLIWHTFPKNNAQPADVVIGQENFENNQPNVKGISEDPTSRSLNWPYGVYSDGNQLWIADTGNRRILYYKSIPVENYSAADSVIGKTDFNTRDYESSQPIWPYSVKVNDMGQMLVADTQFYRVLLWNSTLDASNNPANVIIGQENFEDSGQNQFGLFPSDKCLNWTYDACFYKDGILVNDTGNSRILWFKEIPTLNNPSATLVIGKKDFKTGSDNKDNLQGTDTGLYWPFSICTEKDKLIIADTGNHRLIISKLLF